jgi:hypothetical protein
MADVIIPDGKPAGYYQVVNTVVAPVLDNSVPCAFLPSASNVPFMPYFSYKTNACGTDTAAKITKPFLNGMLSQFYGVVDKGGVRLDADWFCSRPLALYEAIFNIANALPLGSVTGNQTA